MRRRFRQRRLEVLPDVEAAILASAHHHLPALVPEARFLGLYWPLAGEADLRSLSGSMAGRLALPAIEGGSPDQAGMVYRPWRADGPLRPDACGIPAPEPGDGNAPPLGPERMALLLAPSLACDAAGIRLGYGGGWFDRLRSEPAWAAVPTLAVLPSVCRLPALPRDPWDIPLQGWLDETGLHWF
ncbi:5-formyltetrahydrofolate cyclo-ligase [Vulcanococcus limneticus]|uniref:5-formyltetrahydrofolate cyclo-ligase n=1 Tax=Vulcanococcus limneticus TaxID=2170428 RepID=UPI0028F3ECC8|nr:5-formyltetrahydrofolate cyclo-ligase [Vulcanococcus limneticus]